MWSWTRWMGNWVINVTRLWYNRVVLLRSDMISNHLFACEAEPGSGIIELLMLFCYLLLPSTNQLLIQFLSSFLDQLLLIFRNWCYLSIILGEKLIFFFEMNRECVGKSSCRYYKCLSTIIYVFFREEFSFNRLYYLCFGIFLNECYVSRLRSY